MVASYIKMLASSAYFTNVFRGHYESPRVDASISLSLAADDVVPSTRKIKIRGSEFKLFVSIFRKIKEIII